MDQINIIAAKHSKDFSDAKELILRYVEWLNFDLSFQNFDVEMAALPDMYNSRDGGLFVAYLNQQPVAVVGLRRFSDTDAEIKRMFVTDGAKGKGIGKLLLRKCIETAKQLDYKAIKLDTQGYMNAAIHLYTTHGFTEIPAYRYNPHEQTKYFELNLTAAGEPKLRL